jgi:hypothetical protein
MIMSEWGNENNHKEFVDVAVGSGSGADAAAYASRRGREGEQQNAQVVNKPSGNVAERTYRVNSGDDVLVVVVVVMDEVE